MAEIGRDWQGLLRGLARDWEGLYVWIGDISVDSLIE
jgi:hypothetical protein